LIPLNGRKVPATRKWYKRISSVERNGFLNIQTHVTNTKMVYWGFWIFLGWGLTNHVWNGIETERVTHNGEHKHQVYDKLSKRVMPYARVWSRPG